MFRWKTTARRAAVLCVLAAGIGLGGSAQAQTTLRWKFKDGDTQRFNMIQRTESQATVGEQKIEMTQEMSMDLSWKVAKVDADGTATIEQTIDRVKMMMDGQVGRMSFDSRDPDASEGPEQAIAPMRTMFEAMVGKPFISVMTPRGEIKETKIPDSLKDALKAAAPGMESMMEGLMGGGNGKSSLLGNISMFPEEAVSVGKSWSSDADQKLGPLGSMKVKQKYTYAGPVTEGDRSLEKIELDMSMQMEPGKDSPFGNVAMDVKNAKGMLLFDNKAGKLVRSETSTSMTMKMEVQGQQIEQEMETSQVLKPIAEASPGK
jgi:hypothetical protein